MATTRKTMLLLVCVISVSVLLSGCTNWQKKYEAQNVELQNAKGLLDREKTEKGQLADQVAENQKTIEELQKKIAEQKQSPAEASGFGKGYDVAFDPTAGTVTVTLENAILFNSGKAELKDSTSKELDHILSVLKSQYAGRQIAIIGHTDSDPIQKSKWKDNWELSTERSLSVLRYMEQHGIAKDKLSAVGQGDSKPRASNATADGKAKNRRVEIVVHLK
jgi:chemotaxis protein MotB